MVLLQFLIEPFFFQWRWVKYETHLCCKKMNFKAGDDMRQTNVEQFAW